MTPHQAAVESFAYVRSHLPVATSHRTTTIECSTGPENYGRTFVCTAHTKPTSEVLHFELRIVDGKAIFRPNCCWEK